jgi:hypothetical protein
VVRVLGQPDWGGGSGLWVLGFGYGERERERERGDRDYEREWLNERVGEEAVTVLNELN